MVKLDTSILRYLNTDEFRVLVAIEMGMRNHELVPTPLVERIAQLRHGGVKKVLGLLLKYKLIHHDSKLYDGYFLLYPGYDFLALKIFVRRQLITGFGRQIGVGKESDIYICYNENTNQEMVIKFHRLGRVSFRAVRQKRDYLKHRRKVTNWLYMSRLAALKEYAFMKALHQEGFPVPTPIECNRHGILMSLIRGHPLYQIKQIGKHNQKVGTAFVQCIDLIVKLAEYGLVHGDFNEFNLLLVDNKKDEILLYREEEDENDATQFVQQEEEETETQEEEETLQIIMIDFPQMISTSHPHAEEQFDRDINCIHTFFGKRFGFQSDYKPKLQEITKSRHLDVQVEASGFSKEMQQEFDQMIQDQNQEEEEEEEEENEKQVEEESNTPINEDIKTIQSQIKELIGEEEYNSDEDDRESIASKASSIATSLLKSLRAMDSVDIKQKVKSKLEKQNAPNMIRLAKRNQLKGKDKRSTKNESRQQLQDY